MRMRLYSISWWQLLGILLLGSACLVEAGIEATKHNLSVTSGNTAAHKATSEERICLMCHTPHNANPAGPLWNHKLSSSGTVYTPYSSSTLNAAPGQPTGSSKLCLACHDGTIALGALLNMPGAIQGYDGTTPYYGGIIPGLESMITGSANLGIDLRDDHPISFVYDLSLVGYSLELNDPASLTGSVRLDANSELQCTSCHNPHTDAYPKFLRMGFTDGTGFGSPLCRECHDKDGWGVGNKHRDSDAQWNGIGSNPWHITGQNLANDIGSTPKINGCESCHQPHNNPNGNERLLKGDGESRLCLNCHGNNGLGGIEGNVSDSPDSTFNIEASLTKLSPHPSLDAAYDGRHRPLRGDVTAGYNVREDPDNLAEPNRHAECQDCHNPHEAKAGISPNPEDAVSDNTTHLASNVLKGVWGVAPSWPTAWSEVLRLDYTVVDNITHQYQLCLKCHSDYAFDGAVPPDSYAYPGVGTYTLTDQGKEFNPNNPSYHPVTEFAGKNDFQMTVSSVAYDYSSSLLKGFTATSTMGCTDCHSDPDTLDGSGPKGPHGSDNWPILNAPYGATTGQSGTWDTHLCFRCHDKNVYTYANGTTTEWQRTGFSGPDGMGGGGCGGGGGRKNLHAFHSCRRNVPCMTCHSAVPHGMKRRALLIYGRSPSSDAGADPEPYNAQSRRVAVTGSSGADYGIPSALNVDSVASGNWSKSYCHSTAPGVGCAM